MDTLTVRSPAKVNLFLEVVGKRSDGYHDLQTVFQELDLFDEMIVARSALPGIRITSDSPLVPVGSTNLAWRAAEAYFRHTQTSSGVKIHIVKRIPVAAGMGGGSSNAASTLMALQELFGVRLEPALCRRIARGLGADVPFFLNRGTAIGRGIGDELEPLDRVRPFTVVLVNPNFPVPTALVYKELSLSGLRHPVEPFSVLLREGDLHMIARSLFNRLEDVVLRMHPVLHDIKKGLREAGALGAALSGSGPTVFGIAENEDEGRRIVEKVKRVNDIACWTHVCSTATKPYGRDE